MLSRLESEGCGVVVTLLEHFASHVRLWSDTERMRVKSVLATQRGSRINNGSTFTPLVLVSMRSLKPVRTFQTPKER